MGARRVVPGRVMAGRMMLGRVMLGRMMAGRMMAGRVMMPGRAVRCRWVPRPGMWRRRPSVWPCRKRGASGLRGGHAALLQLQCPGRRGRLLDPGAAGLAGSGRGRGHGAAWQRGHPQGRPSPSHGRSPGCGDDIFSRPRAATEGSTALSALPAVRDPRAGRPRGPRAPAHVWPRTDGTACPTHVPVATPTLPGVPAAAALPSAVPAPPRLVVSLADAKNPTPASRSPSGRRGTAEPRAGPTASGPRGSTEEPALLPPTPPAAAAQHLHNRPHGQHGGTGGVLTRHTGCPGRPRAPRIYTGP